MTCPFKIHYGLNRRGKARFHYGNELPRVKIADTGRAKHA